MFKKVIILISLLVFVPISVLAQDTYGSKSYVVPTASPVAQVTPSAANSVNLPLPKHACPVGPKTVINADSLGAAYVKALKQNGVVGKNKIYAMQLVQAFSDVMGCFIHAEIPKN